MTAPRTWSANNASLGSWETQTTSRQRMQPSMKVVWLSSMRKLKWKQLLNRMPSPNKISQSSQASKLWSWMVARRQWLVTVSLTWPIIRSQTSTWSKCHSRISRWAFLPSLSSLLRSEPHLGQVAPQLNLRLIQGAQFWPRHPQPLPNNSKSLKNKWKSWQRKM